LVYLMPERARMVAVTEPAMGDAPLSAPVAAAYSGELHERFQQAAAMLHIGQHLYALEALERVIELAPRLPEARVNAGFALLGLERPDRARQQFETAIDLRPGQANAYYGLGMALEALGDIEGALGAMRSYVHLAKADARHVRLARSAIWEWQGMLRTKNPQAGDREATKAVTQSAVRG
jgi:Flp pilus assembly protein TadD